MKTQTQYTRYFLTTAFALTAILTGCETQSQDDTQAQVVHVVHQSGKMQHDSDAAIRKATATKAWQALKEIADEQIHENAIQIVSLNLPIKKKLALEHRNRDLQFRIDTYPTSHHEWEHFKRAFNNDMQELRAALGELQAAGR